MFHSEVCLSPKQERPSFVLFLARPSPQWFILHQFYSHLPLLHHSVSHMVPKLGFGGRRCFFFPSFFPFHLVSYLLHLSWNSLVYSHKSFVFFGRVSDTLVCLGNRLEVPSRTAAREIGVKGEAVRNADEGKEVVKWGMLNGWDKTPWNN